MLFVWDGAAADVFRRQCTKSPVSKTRPDSVRAKSVRDPGEYQTVLTGPVAGPARPSLIVVPAMCFHEGIVCAEPKAVNKTHCSAQIRAMRIRDLTSVFIGHIDVSQFYPTKGRISYGKC